MMVFAVLSFNKKDKGIELLTRNNCDAVCCLQRCDNHVAKLDINKNVIFDSKVISKVDLVQHLKTKHGECNELNVSIVADPKLEHQFVVDISNFIKSETSNAVVAWSMDN